jgi:tryptophanyl-tRNA synthetase
MADETEKRIVTGIQCTDRPHLGNILGAMLPTLQLAQQASKGTVFIFLADLHTLTSIKDPAARKGYVYAAAAAWLAIGLDPANVTLYRQSRVPAVCELAWYLSCFTPYPMLANAHSFKDKAARLASVNVGLFTYPVLMAADILLYDGEIVPVGKDQAQHLEITRDIALRFNNEYGPIFCLPTAFIDPAIATVPGIDGQKMSKSYHNTIDIFLPEEALRKTIMRIQTDSKTADEPKDPATCIIFKIYSLVASPADIVPMRDRYLTGGYGYGAAKEALYEAILEKFATARKNFERYILNLEDLETILAAGEAQAQQVAIQKLATVRQALGY